MEKAWRGTDDEGGSWISNEVWDSINLDVHGDVK